MADLPISTGSGTKTHLESVGSREMLHEMLALLFYCSHSFGKCAEASGMRLGFGLMHPPEEKRKPERSVKELNTRRL